MPLPTTTNTTSPKAAGLDILIESNYFQLVAQPERPFDLQEAAGEIRAANEFITNPEDLTDRELSPLLSQVDFSGGEGLDFAHRPDNTDFDRTRFWSSDAINVVSGHGDVQKLELENEFSEIHTINASTTWRQSPQMVEANGSLFVTRSAGSSLRVTRIDDPSGTPSATVEDPQAGEAGTDVVSIAEVDDEVYAALGTPNGIHKRDTTGTWSHWSAAQPRRIWGLKGRIVGDVGGDDFYEIRAGSLTNSRLLHSISDGEQFLCAADAGAAILVGATNGYIYAFADVDGDLTLRAQTRFHGEEVTAIGAGPSGIVLVGTKQGVKGRLYMAELGSSYTVQNSQLLREWDISSIDDRCISHITFSRDNAYIMFRAVVGQIELWRFDVATTGLFKMYDNTAVLGVSGVESISNKVFFANLEHDVFGEQNTYQTSGHLISPLFDHFDAEDKVWAAAKFFAVNFPANTSATLSYSTNPDAIENSSHASWTSIKTLNAASGVDDSEALITGAESRWVALKVELSTTDATVTPQVRGYSVRAYAGPGDITMRIPINVSDYVLRPGRQAVRINGFGKTRYDQLKSYEGTAVTLKWLYTGETFEGTVKSIGTRVPLKPRRGSPLLISQVEFVGRRS